MAVKIRRISKAQEEMNMSSISDIVFLLLIYFMVVTVFQQDIGMPFILPAAQQQNDVVKIKESNIAQLSIAANDVITIDDVPIHVNAIKNALQKRLRANPKLVVMVTNHPRSSYGAFAAVLDEVRLAKCRKVAIKMQEG